MSYFKIGNVDLSGYVSGLKVVDNANYISSTNAAGDTKVDLINTKRNIEVTFIPLTDTQAFNVLGNISFNCSISFLNPKTKALETNVNCIVPSDDIEAYTIQSGRVLYKSFTISFKEL